MTRHALRRLAVALAMAVVATIGGAAAPQEAAPATAAVQVQEWGHRVPLPCPPGYWRFHQYGPRPGCGWHTPQALIRRVFTWRYPTAICVATHESGLRAWIVNPSGHAGYFQLAREWYLGVWGRGWWWPMHRPFDPRNPVLNTLAAHVIVSHSGWSAWRNWAGYWCPGW